MFHERTKFKYVQYFYLAIMAILRVYKGNPIEKKSESLVSAFTGNTPKDHSVHLNFFLIPNFFHTISKIAHVS